MPIVGVYTKDPIYNKSIKEALDVDRRADLKAFNYSKNQIARYDALETPQTTAQPTISELNISLINKLKISLDSKFIQLQKINYIFESSSNTTYNIQKLDEVDRINQSETDIITFNSIIGIIKNNAVGGSEKKLVSNELHLLITPLNKLLNMFKTVLKFLLRETGSAEVNVNALFLSTYAVYKTMLESIENNNFNYIDDNSVKATYTNMINSEFANYAKGIKEFRETATNTEYKRFIEDLEDGLKDGRKLSDQEKEKVKNMFKGQLLYNPKYPEKLETLLKDFTVDNVGDQIVGDVWEKEIGAIATGLPSMPYSVSPAVIAKAKKAEKEAEETESESDQDDQADGTESESSSDQDGPAGAPPAEPGAPALAPAEAEEPAEEANKANEEEERARQMRIEGLKKYIEDLTIFINEWEGKKTNKKNEIEEKRKDILAEKEIKKTMKGNTKEVLIQEEKIKKLEEEKKLLETQAENITIRFITPNKGKRTTAKKELNALEKKEVFVVNKGGQPKKGKGLYSVAPREDYYNPDKNDYYNLRF